MEKLRFSSHPRAKVRHQEPQGSARIQPWLQKKKNFTHFVWSRNWTMSINSCNLQGKQEMVHQKKGRFILKVGIIGQEPYANTEKTSEIKYIGSQSQYSTLFCLNKWAIPFVSVFTAVDFCSIIFSRFNFTSPTLKSKSNHYNYYMHVNTIPCCLKKKKEEGKKEMYGWEAYWFRIPSLKGCLRSSSQYWGRGGGLLFTNILTMFNSVVVNFLSQVIFIFLLFQLHKHALPYPKTKEKQKLPEIKH